MAGTSRESTAIRDSPVCGNGSIFVPAVGRLVVDYRRRAERPKEYPDRDHAIELRYTVADHLPSDLPPALSDAQTFVGAMELAERVANDMGGICPESALVETALDALHEGWLRVNLGQVC